MITVAGVTKRYGSSVVVDGVSLQLPVGGVTSIIGPNGAGKSTLLGMVARLLKTDAGRVTVGELDVASCDTRELAKVLSVLKQDNHLAVRLTVEDLVGFGRYPHCGGRLGPRDRAIVEAAIGYLDLEDLRDRYLDEMSGGQRQRAFVAMVLAQDTDYVLLDEPLNNLDMSHARAMMRRLRRAADELQKTIVVVIHDINFASVWSDRIVAMKDGRVAAVGTPADIIDERVLSGIYDMDLAVREVEGQRLALYYA
ncbi:MAG TPA: ATP-binding cassette domain-containing protein [Propionibacterium sp.]|jgi:iron complex transport system ATP-binding protein|nr:ATP-binding cassette domain-containing protein [Propionibacterium sp.]